MGFIVFVFWIALCFVVASFGKDKNIGWGGALVVSLLFSPLIGAIVVAISSKKAVTTLQWKVYAEAAKKAEYKGEVKEAISLYKDAMYHLENDYHNLSGQDEKIRTGRLEELRTKVEELNNTLASTL
ncbi:hypothetical protein [Pontibacter pudoricolor]|uniref:hypothetical protein n=1 Tax=Pontibacter pudoricolor TaxID=2694930 RepID=UPI0013920796|nr:hypothetical protein [Pontibacter pudoricolor]